MTPDEIKTKLLPFIEQSNNELIKFTKVVESHLDLLIELNDYGLTWMNIHKISGIKQTFNTFKGTLVRVRLKAKNKTTKQLKTNDIREKSDVKYNFVNDESNHSSSNEINHDKKSQDSEFNLNEWIEATGLNRNLSSEFKKAEKYGLTPDDFKDIPIENVEKKNNALIIFQKREEECAKNELLSRDFPLKDDLLKKFKR